MLFKTTRKLIEEGTIAPEVAEDILKECPLDGAPIIRNENLTMARCLHPECRGHMKYKADDLMKYLGVKGIGPETCLNFIKSKGLLSHFELVPIIFPNEKPRLHLWEVAMFCYVPGMSKGWEGLLAGYGTFTEFFEKADIPSELISYRKRLEAAEKFFDIKAPLARKKIEVMITGSINGYLNRDHFIDACNDVVGGLVRIKLCGKKQSVHYLIAENKENIVKALQEGMGVTQKAEAAWKGGAKIVTSEEFLKDLHVLVKELLGIKE